jgi:DNA-binding transcriptional ArsR family regulator
VNAFRLTWLASRAAGDGHRVRWTPRKRNERGPIPAVLLAFDYDERSRLCGVRQEDDEATTRHWLFDALANGPRTVEDLAEELADDDETAPHDAALAKAKDRVRQALNRMKHAGLVHKIGRRNGTWAIGDGVSRNGRGDT